MTENIIETKLTPKRNYKATIFEMIYNKNKRELLELYNALNGTDYDNPDDLEITTLENAIYLSIHNDVFFLLDCRLNLYEHQSTYSPNLPLRLLHYISDLYSKLTKDKNLYGMKRVMLPTPYFIIFYNGESKMPDRLELKLSDSFLVKEEEPALELTVAMLNINKGHNKELLDSCKTLRDYAEYTERVRRYAKMMDLADAVERAITECIEENVLADFLEHNRREAMAVSIYEYDYEKHMRMEREEYWQDGHEEGLKEGQMKGSINFVKFCKKIRMEQTVVLNGLLEEYQLSKEDAQNLLKEYWE